MIAFAGRNLKVFFRDKAAVFFSLLASLIIIGLYALFLGNNMASYLEQFPDSRLLVDRWLVAGLVSITSITTAMGAFGVMVDDKSKQIIKDFLTSPIRRWKLMAGYIFSAFIIGYIMSVITLLVAQVYILAQGGSIISLLNYGKVLLVLLLAGFCNTTMVFFFAAFFSTDTSFSTASTVLGTLIGFVTGIYIPIGVLPESVQWVIKLFPTSHAVVILRQILTESTMAKYTDFIPAASLTEINRTMGIQYFFGDTPFPVYGSLLILAGVGVLFFLLSLVHMTKKQA
ncbi:MAG TPA: ABC transporter permease [Candidatus Limiplasma sp.]|nr:ABC transporter permease [Candidatus Limiplasma sp.]HRX09164.1 ABC transporter permease [Candidatus Limiplasma sp.]